ncbi:MAG: hypothetical protein ACREM8_02355, partial [Vulcanimicrobiaceae bacterium]
MTHDPEVLIRAILAQPAFRHAPHLTPDTGPTVLERLFAWLATVLRPLFGAVGHAIDRASVAGTAVGLAVIAAAAIVLIIAVARIVVAVVAARSGRSRAGAQ